MIENIAGIFKAYDIRGKVGSELTREVAWSVGCALADWLPTDGAIAVGYDMRPDSRDLADALIEGVRLQGRDVIDIGMVTTDMVYFAVGSLQLAGGAVVTASHNGGDYNGIKLVREEVKPVGLDTGLDQVRDAAIAGNFVPAAQKGSLNQKDLREEWLAHALSLVKPATWPDYHLAIDGGNGMIGLIAPLLEQKLPRLHVKGLYYEIDGTFPNHVADPQKLENLADLIQVIKADKLDFGLAFDGDGDRAVLVDDLGRPVQGSDMITLIAKHYLAAHPGSEIVHDVRTSRATQEQIRQWGGTPIRTKAGRTAVGAVMRQRKAGFGGETTGHIFFADNYSSDSGLIAALVAIQALSESGKKLSELVDEYRRYAMLNERNLEVSDPPAVLQRLREAFKDGQQDELDGLTVNYPNSWFNIRVSNTEPIMRLNAEAATQPELDQLVDRVSAVIKG